VNPGGQVQVPEGEQTLEEEQAGEQVEDCMSRREREEEMGRLEVSGTASQRMKRFLLEETAIQMLEDMKRELAERGVEELVDGADGRPAKAAWPL